jgi:hypothetical protein
MGDKRDELFAYIHERVSYAREYVPLNIENNMIVITNRIIELHPEMTPEIATKVGILLYDQTGHTFARLRPPPDVVVPDDFVVNLERSRA